MKSILIVLIVFGLAVGGVVWFALRDGREKVEPRLGPAAGAALRAAMLSGAPLDAGAVAALAGH